MIKCNTLIQWLTAYCRISACLRPPHCWLAGSELDEYGPGAGCAGTGIVVKDRCRRSGASQRPCCSVPVDPLLRATCRGWSRIVGRQCRRLVRQCPGALLMLSSTPCWNGATGSTITGCWNRSATCHRRKKNRRIIVNWKGQPWWSDSNNGSPKFPGLLHGNTQNCGVANITGIALFGMGWN